MPDYPTLSEQAQVGPEVVGPEVVGATIEEDRDAPLRRQVLQGTVEARLPT